jgi:hypothetical protein
MPWATEDKSEKAVFVFLNICLATIWILFLIRLITHWNTTGPGIRNHACVFMAFFSFWWTTLIRQKRAVPLLLAGGVFATVYDMVRPLM